MNKDNSLLVDFEMVVDLDLAMFKLIREKYNNPEYVDQAFIHMNDEKEIIRRLMYRKHINPLEIIMPNVDSTKLYNQFRYDKLDELLQYANATDIFGLMITLIKEASSVDITILCENKLEEEFLHKLNHNINIYGIKTIVKEPANVITKLYSAIYIKYLSKLFLFKKPQGCYIYLANAGYNIGKDFKNADLLLYYIDINIIKCVDLYRSINYQYKEGDKNE